VLLLICCGCRARLGFFGGAAAVRFTYVTSRPSQAPSQTICCSYATTRFCLFSSTLPLPSAPRGAVSEMRIYQLLLRVLFSISLVSDALSAAHALSCTHFFAGAVSRTCSRVFFFSSHSLSVDRLLALSPCLSLSCSIFSRALSLFLFFVHTPV